MILSVVKIVSVAGFEELRLQGAKWLAFHGANLVSVAGFEELRLQGQRLAHVRQAPRQFQLLGLKN